MTIIIFLFADKRKATDFKH